MEQNTLRTILELGDRRGARIKEEYKTWLMKNRPEEHKRLIARKEEDERRRKDRYDNIFKRIKNFFRSFFKK